VTIETGIVLEEFYRCIYIFAIWLYIANIKEDGSKSFGSFSQIWSKKSENKFI
jgi:hypothetical protein